MQSQWVNASLTIIRRTAWKWVSWVKMTDSMDYQLPVDSFGAALDEAYYAALNEALTLEWDSSEDNEAFSDL